MTGLDLDDVSELSAVYALQQRAATALDKEALQEWVSLFHPDGLYEITAYSHEVREEVVWWRADVDELTKTLDEVDQHVRDSAQRRRILGGSIVQKQDGHLMVETPFAIYRTTKDGESSLYVVGRYVCRLERWSGAWRYKHLKVILDTRVLAMFTHLPL